jgi:hypothetical protein
MRTIIRFSLDRNKGSKLRNKLKGILKRYGIKWQGDVTGTYEHHNISAIDLAAALGDFWAEVNQMPRPTHLDHFWLYTDNPPKPVIGLKMRKSNPS